MASFAQPAAVRWIDTVDMKHAWQATMIVDKTKRKGELVIGVDNVVVFVSGSLKTELMKHDLADFSGYDRKQKKLRFKALQEPIQMELSKANAAVLNKEIEDAGRRKAPAPKGAQSPVELAPALPERSATSPKLPSAPIQQLPLPTPASAKSPGEAGPFVTALYDYEPQEEDELKISEDERLRLIDESDDDWWMVQRLHGSMRKGLVPSSYLQRAGGYLSRMNGQEAVGADEEEDERATSPRPKVVRPGTPGSPVPSFLDELKGRQKARSPVPTPEPEPVLEETVEYPESPAQDFVDAESLEATSAASSDGTQATKPKSGPRSPLAAVVPEAPLEGYADEPAEPESPVAEPVAVHRPPMKEPAIPEPPTARPAVPAPATAQPAAHELAAAAKRAAVQPEAPRMPTVNLASVPSRAPAAATGTVRAEPEVVRQPAKAAPKSEFTLPKLKPVLKDDKGFNALSSMLMKKQEDILHDRISSPEPVHRPKTPVTDTGKQSSWKGMKVPSAGKAPVVAQAPAVTASPAKALPSRPPQAQSAGKPTLAEIRLWTSRNGEFQTEAKYNGYSGGKVSLHKLNGASIVVPLEQLCERDKEFVYRQEKIPWDNGPKRDFKVGTFDWLAFFTDAGLDSRAARTHAQSCLDKKVGETFMMSSHFNRDFLLGLGMAEADTLEVLRFCIRSRARLTEDAVVQKNLEKIQQAKQEKQRMQQAMEPKALPRRASEAFAQIELPMMHSLTLEPQQQQPAYLQPQPARTVRDLPTMEPLRKDEPRQTMFTSTTMVSSAPQNAAHALAGYAPAPQMPVQAAYAQAPPPQASRNQQNMQYAQQQYAQMHAQQPQQQQPTAHYALPNLSQAQPYMPPPQQPIHQQYHTMQQGPGTQPLPMAGGFPVLNTTQYRTEFYGYNANGQPHHGQQPPMHPAMPMAHAYQAHPTHQAHQAQAPAAQQHHPAAMPAAGGPGAGDKYSIFRYVDPSAPQVLHQAPPPGGTGYPPNAPHGTGWQR